MNIGTTDPYEYYDLEVVDAATIRATPAISPMQHVSNWYLGAITNADGSVVYWENDTKPLP